MHYKAETMHEPWWLCRLILFTVTGVLFIWYVKPDGTRVCVVVRFAFKDRSYLIVLKGTGSGTKGRGRGTRALCPPPCFHLNGPGRALPSRCPPPLPQMGKYSSEAASRPGIRKGVKSLSVFCSEPRNWIVDHLCRFSSDICFTHKTNNFIAQIPNCSNSNCKIRLWREH